MSSKLYFQIALRIVILCASGMLMTYIPEHLRGFFGDILKNAEDINRFEPDRFYEWGSRHYWYFWMMIALFALSVINLITWIFNKVDQ